MSFFSHTNWRLRQWGKIVILPPLQPIFIYRVLVLSFIYSNMSSSLLVVFLIFPLQCSLWVLHLVSLLFPLCYQIYRCLFMIADCSLLLVSILLETSPSFACSVHDILGIRRYKSSSTRKLPNSHCYIGD